MPDYSSLIIGQLISCIDKSNVVHKVIDTICIRLKEFVMAGVPIPLLLRKLKPLVNVYSHRIIAKLLTHLKSNKNHFRMHYTAHLNTK